MRTPMWLYLFIKFPVFECIMLLLFECSLPRREAVTACLEVDQIPLWRGTNVSTRVIKLSLWYGRVLKLCQHEWNEFQMHIRVCAQRVILNAFKTHRWLCWRRMYGSCLYGSEISHTWRVFRCARRDPNNWIKSWRVLRWVTVFTPLFPLILSYFREFL